MKVGLTMALLAAAVFAAPATAQSPYAGRFETTVNDYTFEQAPDWMPGGKRVVAHAPPAEREDNQIFTSRLDGTARVCLTCGTAGPNMVPVAQPHGDWVLYHGWSGHQLTVGAPGFGGMGSDLWAVRADGSGDPVRLTTSEEGHDNFHAYWSPDGNWIAWTSLNWNFVTEDGNGKSEIRVARFRTGGAQGARLTDVHAVRPPNGHWYETQWWAPDGSGFLYTESVGESINNELFFCRLPNRTQGRCDPVRLTRDPAWDEQAIFTPDMARIIFMSTRDNPGAYEDWAMVSQALGLPADYDYALILPVFELAFLQPVFEQATDLYDFPVRYTNGEVSGAGPVRRLTRSGERGWVKPEFAFDDAGERLLWTQVRIHEGVRIDQRFDAIAELLQLVAFLQDPSAATQSQLGIGVPTQKVTLIGRFKPR
jgi:hypothetical protein